MGGMTWGHALGYIVVFFVGAWAVSKMPQLNIIGRVTGA